MRGNRKTDSGPELAVRRAVYQRGLRYRVNLLLRAGGIAVRPDLVFPRARVAVFVDGCFWHGCPVHGTQPRSNTNYWGPKIARNQERDRHRTALLTTDGWTVIRAWEHEPADAVAARIERAVRGRSAVTLPKADPDDTG